MYEYRKLTQEQREELVKARLSQGYPPHQPPHYANRTGTYLLTAACYEHRHCMESRKRREQTLDLLFEQCIHHSIQLIAWAILPNHYHLLAKVPDLVTFGESAKRVHGSLSRQWNIEDNTRGRRIWYRYADRAIRSERHYYTTLNYIHFNPVKHNYVASPYDWSCNSVHWYLETKGRDWLRDLWRNYPLHDYGKRWDDI